MTDRLGSVRQDVTMSGTVSDQITYDSYGSIISETNANSGDRFKYTGRELDSETGLYFYRSRYYWSAVGRFVNEDPLNLQPDANPFRYVHNLPVLATDPFGLWLITGTITGPLPFLGQFGFAGGVQFSFGTGGRMFNLLGGVQYPPSIVGSLVFEPLGSVPPIFSGGILTHGGVGLLGPVGVGAMSRINVMAALFPLLFSAPVPPPLPPGFPAIPPFLPPPPAWAAWLFPPTTSSGVGPAIVFGPPPVPFGVGAFAWMRVW